MHTKPLEAIMQKEMSRKEFMTTLGFGLASIMGFSSLLKLMGHGSMLSQKKSSGYGSSAYGR